MDNNIGFIFCLLYCYKMLPILILPKSRFLSLGKCLYYYSHQ